MSFKSRYPQATDLRDVTEHRVRFALRRLGWLLPRAEVQMSGVHGRRGGIRKRCQVEHRTGGAGLLAWVSTTCRDLSFMGGFLFAGMAIALIAGLGAMFLQRPALELAVAAVAALLSAGMILFETSRIVTAGETNYVPATVGLYVSNFDRFTSLLSLFGFGSPDE